MLWWQQWGGAKIFTRELRQKIFEETEYLKKSLGRTLSMQEVRQMGVGYRVLQGLINEALLDEEVARLGIAISDEMLKESIAQEKSFQNERGCFSKERFMRFLRSSGLTEAGFLNAQRKVLKRQQLLRALGSMVDAPKNLSQLISAAFLQKRVAHVYRVESVANLAAPTRQELLAFFEKEKTRFKRPEERDISFSILDARSFEKKGFKKAEALRKVHEVAETVEDSLAGGLSIKEISANLGISMYETTLCEHTQKKDLSLGEWDNNVFIALRRMVLSVENHEGPTLERLMPGVYVLLDIRVVRPAYVPLFEDVQKEVKEAWYQSEKKKVTRSVATDIWKAMQKGEYLDRLRPLPAVSLNEKREEVHPQIQTALFQIAPGDLTLVETNQGDFFVVRCERLVSSDAASVSKMFSELKPKVDQALREDLLGAYVSALKAHHHTQINQQALMYAMS